MSSCNDFQYMDTSWAEGGLVALALLLGFLFGALQKQGALRRFCGASQLPRKV